MNIPGDKPRLVLPLAADLDLLLVPLAVSAQPREHEVVALLREELGPVAQRRLPVRRLAQQQFAALLHEPLGHVHARRLVRVRDLGRQLHHRRVRRALRRRLFPLLH